MINITNEGWFGETAAPYQMVAISVFRAAENRVSLTRSANTGVSCFIDSFGRITGRVTNAGKDIFVKGFLTQDAQISKEKTFYTLYGDIFVYICAAISFIGIIAALIKRKR
jgi:apolipoprotein N-acyltransferase